MADAPTIRRGEERDAAVLARFNVAMARETEGKELSQETAEAGSRALLRHPEHGFYVVAEVNGEVVGALLVTHEWSDWRNGLFWWIQSVYVCSEHRRQGIYRALHTHVKSRAAEAEDVCGLRLYVDRHNQPARQAYASLGMQQTPYRIYEEMLTV